MCELWLEEMSQEGWELVAVGENLNYVFRKRDGPSPETVAVLEELKEAQELVDQAYRQWTPTQSPSTEWEVRARLVSEKFRGS